MNFNISILNVASETKPTAKGSYQQLEVAFKNLDSGKVESKKIMSFASKDAYTALVNAKAGESFTITSEKNEKTGYWDWVKAVQAAPGQAVAAQNNAIYGGKAPVQVKSTYETPEERAKKQVYIIKQSSLSSAVATLSVGAKSVPPTDAVLALAEVYFGWVMADPSAAVSDDLFNMPNDNLNVE